MPTKERTKCAIYTRVMGYLRPVSYYNLGKKSEFYSRTYFDAVKSMNWKFNQENCSCKTNEIYIPQTMTINA